VEGDGQVALGLAAIGLEPELARLLEEEINRRFVLRPIGRSLRKKLAHINTARRSARHIFLRLRPLLDSLVFLGHPRIEPLQ